MAIDEKNIKLLWGRAAGRCSKCGIDLTIELEDTTDSLYGEMAHVIARKVNGPRGSDKFPKEKLNTYDNLILLCPNHHRMIDKAPSKFSIDEILRWKEEHEKRIKYFLRGNKCESNYELFSLAKNLLLENKRILEFIGPNSNIAKINPISDAFNVWEIKKLSVIIPNNQRIVNSFEANYDLLNDNEKEIFQNFKIHASLFEENSKHRIDDEAVPQFPEQFFNMINSTNNSFCIEQEKASRDSTRFFKNVIIGHDRVIGMEELRLSYYCIRRSTGCDLMTLVVETYTLGLSDYYNILKEYPDISVIVIMSSWNGYTSQAKQIAQKNKIGIFTLKEFMGAINTNEFYKYCKKDDNGINEYLGTKMYY